MWSTLARLLVSRVATGCSGRAPCGVQRTGAELVFGEVVLSFTRDTHVDKDSYSLSPDVPDLVKRCYPAAKATTLDANTRPPGEVIGQLFEAIGAARASHGVPRCACFSCVCMRG